MFSRAKRLSRSDFSKPSLTRGKRLSGVHVSITIPLEGTGYAVIVSKKTAKLSVTRHRIKRRVLAALRTLTLPPSLVVYPKLSVLTLPPKALHAELTALISRI